MKKIISLIIAVTLILTLCPLTFAAETEEFTGYNYVFTREALKSETDISYTNLLENSYSVDSGKSDPWKVASWHRGSASVNESYLRYSSTRKTGVACFAIKIDVAQGGEYTPKLTYDRHGQSPIVDIYLVKDGIAFSYGDVSRNTSEIDGLTKDLLYSALYEIAYYFTKGYPEGTNGAYTLKTELDMYSGAGSDTEEKFDNCKLTLEDNTSYYLIFRIAGVNAALAANDDWSWYVQPNSFSLTPVQDPIPADEFNAVEDKTTITSYDVGPVSAVAYTLGTDAQDSNIVVTAKDNNDGTYTLNAPEYDGYNFLYWKKGATTKKDVITYKATDFVYAPTAGENNIVIAVYEKIGEITTAKAEFYNANGQFIKATDGAFPTEIPSMAGYGDATGWQCYTDGETYGLNDSVTPNGIMLFVADYKDTLDTVKVNGEDVPYGTEITFTAKPETDKKFKCWTRTDKAGNTEIVGIEETYKFCAYEDCTITEVDTEGTVVLPTNTRKIVLDTFSVGSATALMAEFIGFKNDTVVEKGIMFGNNRIAMKSTGTQFTIIPDENGTYKGYAIVGNATDGYTLITDGEYTKSAEAE